MNPNIRTEGQLKDNQEDFDDWLDRLREYSQEKRRALDTQECFSEKDHDELVRKHRV